jgi:hypothetical protein
MIESLPNKRIAALALYLLGGASRAVDTEDVAIKAAELAPGRFRWKKYPEQIDLERVRLSIKNLRDDRPSFISGGMRNGWMLTPAGIAWCRQIAGQQASTPGPAVSSLRSTAAFQKWQDGRAEEITVYDARQLLQVDEYTSDRRRRERIQAVGNAAADDPDLSSLLVHLRKRFPKEW